MATEFQDPYVEYRKAISKRTDGKPVAHNCRGLWGASSMWKCPRCQGTNHHNMPWNPEHRSFEEMMFNTTRMCDRCGCDYVLGPISIEDIKKIFKEKQAAKTSS
jgi:hypothetical protein